jgi:hypothetical protein
MKILGIVSVQWNDYRQSDKWMKSIIIVCTIEKKCWVVNTYYSCYVIKVNAVVVLCKLGDKRGTKYCICGKGK